MIEKPFPVEALDDQADMWRLLCLGQSTIGSMR